MKSMRFLAAFIGCLAISGALSPLPAQSSGLSVEQRLRSQYRIASVGGNGVVVRPGTVVVIQQDGMTAIQVTPEVAPGSSYWPNTYKKGGHVGTSAMQRMNYAPLKNWARPVQVGEKAYITSIQVKSSDIVFGLQTCPANPNETPYQASLAFQFRKGDLGFMDFKQIQETIADVLTIDTSSTTEATVPSPGAGHRRKATGEAAGVESPQASSTYIAPLKLPSTYVNAEGQTDQLQLNADQSFSLQEAGQSYNGTFVDNGNTLELSISETNTKTTATRQGSNLTDSSGQTWVLREQSAATAPAGATLNNDDIVKMAKAGFDDAIIVAKIGSSRCQFDTSTDALIRLKQSGVSGAVIRAMVVGPSTGAK